MDGYKTPGGQATATVEEKKSSFIALIAPAAGEEQALDVLGAARAAHRTANHNVYAYVLRQNARARYSDDGEPAKTAGLPVLSVIQHAGLMDCIIVVTRYFGGVLLGTGGLVRAYTAAAQAAVHTAPIATVRVLKKLSVTLPYPLYEQARRILNEAGARLEEPVFAADVRLCAVLPAGETDAPLARLREVLRGSARLAVSETYEGLW